MPWHGKRGTMVGMTDVRATLDFVLSPYLSATCSILNDGTDALVVDPGLEVHAEVTNVLEEKGLNLRAILVSHGHLDHVADAALLASQFDVPVYVGARDEYRLEDPMGQ